MFSTSVLGRIGYSKSQKKMQTKNVNLNNSTAVQVHQGTPSSLTSPAQSLLQLSQDESRMVAPPLPPRTAPEPQAHQSSSAQGGVGDVTLPGAASTTCLHTHSAKFPIEREIVLSNSEKGTGRIPILTEYMRKAKPAAVAPDAPHKQVAWIHTHRSMENLSSTETYHEMAGLQVYKAEPMSIVDSSQASEPSPIWSQDQPNHFSSSSCREGPATSTPDTGESGGANSGRAFPSRTYHSIKDMISSRFTNNKKELSNNNNSTDSLSPQSQLRQHGVYLASSAQDMRQVGRPRSGEGVYARPASQVAPDGMHQPGPQPMYRSHQEMPPPSTSQHGPYHPHRAPDGDMVARNHQGQYRPEIHMPVRTYTQPMYEHHQYQGHDTHHKYQGYPETPVSRHQQVYSNGPGSPMPRHQGPGRVQPSPMMPHHQFREGMRAPVPHEPMVHRPTYAQENGHHPPMNHHEPSTSRHNDHNKTDGPGLQHHTTYVQLHGHEASAMKHQGMYLQAQSQDYVPQPSYNHNPPQQPQQPQQVPSQQAPPQTPVPAERHPTPTSQSPDTTEADNQKNDRAQANEVVSKPEEPTTNTQAKPEEPAQPHTDLNEINKIEEPTRPPSSPKIKPAEPEEDDEGGFAKTGTQTDSGRGSTVYSSGKAKPSPEPTSNQAGEWVDLVENELRNILGPNNNGANSTLSDSISSVSPPLPPLSPNGSSEDLTQYRNRKSITYSSKGKSNSAWRSAKTPTSRAQPTSSTKNGRTIISSSLEIDSMLDENNSSEEDLDYTDVRAIRKQLEGLETMYAQVLKLLGVKKGARYEASDPRIHRRRVCGSISSVPSSVSSRPIRDKRRDARNKVRDIKGINKRFQRLESHVVTLARSVAHLSSEMRTQHLMMQKAQEERKPTKTSKLKAILPSSKKDKKEMEVIRGELASLRLQANLNQRNSSQTKPTPDKVKKLTKFFGDEPPLLRLFLKQLGYEKYAPMFEKERIGLVELPYLTEERLHKLGIPLGPRLRIMQQAQFALATQHPNTLCIV